MLNANSKPGSSGSCRPQDSGLSRQDFLRQTGVVAIMAGLLAIKPTVVLSAGDQPAPSTGNITFSKPQQTLLQAVQMQLFPADGDGPSAQDLQSLRYLLWALQDPANIADGDPVFIRNGLTWLEDEARRVYQQPFTRLAAQQQDAVLQQIARTTAGENWLSLLLYYLIESLTLDPVYGGNPDGIGWRWLQHQPGFPRPTPATRYRHYVG